MGRYINHSCDPNLVMNLVRVDSMVPDLALYTRRDIQRDTELTFNYGNPSMAPEGNRNDGEIPCHCQAEICTGFLPFHKYILQQ